MRWLVEARVALALWWHGGQKVVPQQVPTIHAAMTELATVAGISVPVLFAIPSLPPDGFALRGSQASLALTEPILSALNPSELRGLLALLVADLAGAAAGRLEVDGGDLPGRSQRQIERGRFAIDGFAADLAGGNCVAEGLQALRREQRRYGPNRRPLSARLFPGTAGLADTGRITPADDALYAARLARLRSRGAGPTQMALSLDDHVP